VLSVVTGFVVLLFGMMAKLVVDERAGAKEARNMHAECMEEHAATREEKAALKESVRILTMHVPDAGPQVHDVLAAADVRVEEIKQALQANKKA